MKPSSSIDKLTALALNICDLADRFGVLNIRGVPTRRRTDLPVISVMQVEQLIGRIIRPTHTRRHRRRHPDSHASDAFLYSYTIFTTPWLLDYASSRTSPHTFAATTHTSKPIPTNSQAPTNEVIIVFRFPYARSLLLESYMLFHLNWYLTSSVSEFFCMHRDMRRYWQYVYIWCRVHSSLE